MSPVYVNRRPCGCRDLSVPLTAPADVCTVKAKLTGGWSLQAFDAPDADRLPTACDICAPVRQEMLL